MYSAIFFAFFPAVFHIIPSTPEFSIPILPVYENPPSLPGGSSSIFPPLRLPDFLPLSGGFYGGKIPKILPSFTPLIPSYYVSVFFKTNTLSEHFVTLSAERCPFPAWFPTSKNSISATFSPIFLCLSAPAFSHSDGIFAHGIPHQNPLHFPHSSSLSEGVLRCRRKMRHQRAGQGG